MKVFKFPSLLVLLLTGCATNAIAPSTPTAILTLTPTSGLSTSPTFAPTQSSGKLTGRVTIGPLSPVERIGVTPPPIPPEVFTSRSINIFGADGATLITTVKIKPDGTYEVALPSGIYVVNIARTGIDRARNLPKTITIESGRTVQLDIDIDTGIR